jgi:TRAP transporter TAXI family solute receptor
VLARVDAGISTFNDLKGKRVNIGPPGSGGRNTTDVLLQAVGWGRDAFALTSELKATEQAQALCDNKVDAIVYVVGHPNGSIQEATTACDSRLVSVKGPGVEKLLADNVFYGQRALPGGVYRGNPDPVETFGVRATFVTSASVPDDVVYVLVKAVFDKFDNFKRLHPVFENLVPEQMVSDGLFAPVHGGAARYYRERGWLD